MYFMDSYCLFKYMTCRSGANIVSSTCCLRTDYVIKLAIRRYFSICSGEFRKFYDQTLLYCYWFSAHYQTAISNPKVSRIFAWNVRVSMGICWLSMLTKLSWNCRTSLLIPVAYIFNIFNHKLNFIKRVYK